MINRLAARYQCLTTSNQTIVWTLIILFIIWPLQWLDDPFDIFKSFFIGCIFGGEIVALLYFGEQKEEI